MPNRCRADAGQLIYRSIAGFRTAPLSNNYSMREWAFDRFFISKCPEILFDIKILRIKNSYSH